MSLTERRMFWNSAEFEKEAFGYWTSGFLEDAGSLRFAIQRKIRQDGTLRYHVYPLIDFTDTSSEKISKLQTILGCGVIRPCRENNWTFGIYKKSDVNRVLDLIRSKTISRADFIAVSDAVNEVTGEGAAALAQAFQDFKNPPSEPAAYRDLVGIPHFVAGLIDAKGHFYPSGSVDLYSINLVLLSALRERYGGSIWVQVPAGPRKSGEGTERIINVQNKYYGMRFYPDQLKSLMLNAGHLLKLR